jgi:hypothetical protein
MNKTFDWRFSFVLVLIIVIVLVFAIWQGVYKSNGNNKPAPSSTNISTTKPNQKNVDTMIITEVNSMKSISVKDVSAIQRVLAALSEIPNERGPVQCPDNTGAKYQIIFSTDGKAVLKLTAEDYACKFVSYMREQGDPETWSYSIGGNRTWDNEAGKTFWLEINSLLLRTY